MQNGHDIGGETSSSRSLFADRVHKVYENTPLGVTGGLVNAVILVYILDGQVPLTKLLVWLACTACAAALRMTLHWRYHHSSTQSSHSAKWDRWFLVSLGLAGLIWGAVPVFLFPASSFGHQAFIAFLSGGMVAGAAGVYSALIADYFVFSIPVMLPIGIRFFMLGGHIHVAMGGMIVLYFIIISMVALRAHRDIGDLLALKYERMALVTDLQLEIAQRSEAQRDLQRQKERVEQIVAKRTAALDEANQRLRAILNYAPLALWAIDREGGLSFCDGKGLATIGLTPGVVGKSIFDLYSQESPMVRITQGVLSGTFISDTVQFKDVCVEVRYQPMRDTGDGLSGAIGVAIDVTEQTRAKEALRRSEEKLRHAQKMEALGTLAGGVAHDLNNILSGIVSYPDLLLMDLPRDSPLRRPLSTIKKSGENAAAIVQDLLTLARRGVGALTVLNLNRIVMDCINSPEIQVIMAQGARMSLAVSLQPDLFNIHGSAIHIFKSLTNLICNAVEAMPEGGRIEITTENRFADRPLSRFETIPEGEYVILGVKDSGVGIPENDRARIFEPFYTSKLMGRSGSGLGMAVVWGTVKDHNGYLDFESAGGEGTRFELYFPATREETEAFLPPEDLSDLTGHGEFILVVDDMPVQREIARGILDRLGYRVESLASGEEAVRFIQQDPVDLVILDMIMTPGIDGYETYRRIKSIRPDQKAIIASGFSESDRVRKAIRLGVGRYLKKPYQLAELGAAIREELQKDGS